MPVKKYYINIHSQANGDHEVHDENCHRLPSELNRKYLGLFSDCHAAVKEAKKYYPKVDGCYYCSSPCHHQ